MRLTDALARREGGLFGKHCLLDAGEMSRCEDDCLCGQREAGSICERRAAPTWRSLTEQERLSRQASSLSNVLALRFGELAG